MSGPWRQLLLLHQQSRRSFMSRVGYGRAFWSTFQPSYVLMNVNGCRCRWFSSFVIGTRPSFPLPVSPCRWYSKDAAVNKGIEDSSKDAAIMEESNSNSKGKRKSDVKGPQWNLIGKLAPLLWPRNSPTLRRNVIGGALLLLAGKGVNVLVPYIFKMAVNLVDADLASGLVSELSVMEGAGLMFLLFGVARISARFFEEMKNVLFSRVSQAAQRSVASRTFAHLHSLDATFHATASAGVLARKIERGVRGINYISTALLFNFLPTFFEILLVCAILTWQFGPLYAAVAAGTVGVYVLWTIPMSSWRTRFRVAMNEAENRASGLAIDSLSNQETVKLFCGEQKECEAYESALGAYEAAARHTASSLALLNVGQQTIFSLSLAGIMWMAGTNILHGVGTVGDLVLVNGLLFQLSLPLAFLGSVYRELQNALIDIAALFTLLQKRPANSAASGKSKDVVLSMQSDSVSSEICRTNQEEDRRPSLAVTHGTIVFDHVHFKSPSTGRVLIEDLCLTIPGGSRVALVGASGTGKSTLARLLVALEVPQSGRIFVDGQDISKVNLRSLRSAVGLVSQDAALLNRTVFENLTYGTRVQMMVDSEASVLADDSSSKESLNVPDRFGASMSGVRDLPTEKEVMAACRTAQIEQLVKRLGLHAHIGNRGVLLSGGERQRLSVARTLLSSPPIVIFDEATSALDLITERALLNSLHGVLRNRTCVYIAHRLSAVSDADLIIVMGDRGHVLEQGTHWKLLANVNGPYYSLWHAHDSKSSD